MASALSHIVYRCIIAVTNKHTAMLHHVGSLYVLSLGLLDLEALYAFDGRCGLSFLNKDRGLLLTQKSADFLYNFCRKNFSF